MRHDLPLQRLRWWLLLLLLLGPGPILPCLVLLLLVVMLVGWRPLRPELGLLLGRQWALLLH